MPLRRRHSLRRLHAAGTRRPGRVGSEAEVAAPPDDAGLAFHGLAPRPSLDSWGELRRDAGPVRLFHESQNTNARLAGLTEGLVPFPEVGQEFLGFRLRRRARPRRLRPRLPGSQGDLADRPVALKVSTGCFAESQKLARLQHTHIVPIYSLPSRRPAPGRVHAVLRPDHAGRRAGRPSAATTRCPRPARASSARCTAAAPAAASSRPCGRRPLPSHRRPASRAGPSRRRPTAPPRSPRCACWRD